VTLGGSCFQARVISILAYHTILCHWTSRVLSLVLRTYASPLSSKDDGTRDDGLHCVSHNHSLWIIEIIICITGVESDQSRRGLVGNFTSKRYESSSLYNSNTVCVFSNSEIYSLLILLSIDSESERSITSGTLCLLLFDH